MCASIRKTSEAACGPTFYLLTPTHDLCSGVPILASTSLSDVHLHLPIHRPPHLRCHFHLHLLELLSSPALPTSCPLLLFCAVHLVHLLVNVHLLARHLDSLPIRPCCRNSTCLFSSKMLKRQEGRITDRLPYLAQTTQLLPGNTINAASNSLRFGISDQTAAEKKHQCSRSLFLCR